MSGAPPAHTAREAREVRRAEFARHLARTLADAGVSVLEVARLVGASGTVAARWTTPGEAAHLSLADARALPAAVRRGLATWLLGDGLAVVDLPEAPSEDLAHELHLAATMSFPTLAPCERLGGDGR